MDNVDDAKAILKIADHCQCYGLKHAAEIRLASKLMSKANPIDLGLLAVSHSCPLLLEECGAAIVKNFQELRNSPSWTDLSLEPKLMQSLRDPSEPKMDQVYKELAAKDKLCLVDGIASEGA